MQASLLYANGWVIILENEGDVSKLPGIKARLSAQQVVDYLNDNNIELTNPDVLATEFRCQLKQFMKPLVSWEQVLAAEFCFEAQRASAQAHGFDCIFTNLGLDDTYVYFRIEMPKNDANTISKLSYRVVWSVIIKEFTFKETTVIEARAKYFQPSKPAK